MADVDVVDVVDVLRRTNLFVAVDKKAMKSIAAEARVVHHDTGAEIAQEGGGGVAFHVIAAGTASVSLHGRTHRQLHAGDYFGEIALIDGKPRSAEVVATTPLTTVALASWEFRPILHEEPGVAFELLKLLCVHLREAEAG